MADITDDQTLTRVAEVASPETITRTRTIHDVVEGAGLVRTTARIIDADAADIQHRALEVHLDSKARQLVKVGAKKLLHDLSEGGFAWRDIARLVGVSVPAVRRWRLGESPTPEHLVRIARLVALAETLRSDHMIVRPASWMEVPLTPSVPLTGMDLAAEGRHELLVDYAAEHLSAEQVLDRWHSDWRERYQSPFEVFKAPDGELGIRFSQQEEA